ncbi:MAG TPA: tyrosine-type recombinase/integrase [Trebonia sp.]|nr:tyrosine-type recombinase/integrase [Trebonia sp.]
MQRYDSYLARALPGQTARTYSSAARMYLSWLSTGAHDGEPLADAAARDWAVRDYRTHLVTVVKRAPATVNKALAAVENLYAFLGMPVAKGTGAKRQELPAKAPRALSPRARTRFLRAVEACPSARDRAMALLPFYAGLRVSEVAGLDVDDITMSARKGAIRIVGKGEKTRTVPVHPKLREALTAWLAVRPATGDKALFLTRLGSRPTSEAVDDVIAAMTRAAGLDEEITAHVLRHTFGTTMVRDGVDIVQVAHLLGHSRLETTRRYAAPSDEDLEKAIMSLAVDD